ncbi:MAG TPA: hypothetical protein VFV34_02015 [Blastocatellia bacterium]|nr:hypothetical protein [Blastocatellia bacterium]
MGDRESFPSDDRSVFGAGRMPGPGGVDPFGSPSAIPADSSTKPGVTSVVLKGLTEADFSSNFALTKDSVKPATGCKDCPPGNCVKVTGVLVNTFTVKTTVTLPKVSDFPDLTPCQKKRVQDAIDNKLAPHEQEHVKAFKTFEGTTTKPIDITMCKGDDLKAELKAKLQAIHDAEEGPRKAAARAKSAALDPFQVKVNLDCED